MPKVAPRFGVIIPSFNDERIAHTIMSVRLADPNDLSRIYIVDGGSAEALLSLIRKCLRPHDVLVSEKDKGVFDALNKGLDIIREPYFGWLGSDDFYTGEINVAGLTKRFDEEGLDCIIFGTALVDDTAVRRVTHGFAPTLLSYKRGRFIPHFSSFWRLEAIGEVRFDLNYPIASDQDFFLKVITQRKLAYAIDRRMGTGQRLGGLSTGAWRRIAQANLDSYRIYSQHMGPVIALFAVSQKLLSKFGWRQWGSHPPLMKDITDAVMAAARL